MVTREFLATLPTPSFGIGFDRAQIMAILNAGIQEAVPGWDPADRDPQARANEALAETIWIMGEINEAQALRTMLYFAVGDDLTWLAADRYRVYRRPGETDDELRDRAAEAPVLVSVATEARNRKNAFDSLTDIVDVDVFTRVNRQDVDLYCLAADQAALTEDQWADVIRYVNRTDQKIQGVTIFRANPTVTMYHVTMAGTRDAGGVDAATLEEAMRRSLTAYMASVERMGFAVFASALVRASGASTQDNPIPTIHQEHVATQADVDAGRANNVGDTFETTGDLKATPGTVYVGRLNPGWFQMVAG